MAKKTEYELLIDIGAQVNKSVVTSIGNVTGLLKKAFGAKVIWDGVSALGSKVVEIGSESMDMYTELEKSAVNAANVFGGTAEEVDLLEQQIQQLAKTTSTKIPLTAKEISDSMYYLGQVGLSYEQSAGVLDDMLKLALVDGQDVATIVDMVTDSMSAMNMEINKGSVNEYMNQIAQVMASTNTSAMGALEAIEGFGGTAGMLGAGIEEVASLVGVLANTGTKGSEAGTALNSMMTRMVGGMASAGYEKLGVDLYNQTGEFKGFAEVLKEVNNALEGMSSEAADPIMKTIFGTHYMNEGMKLLKAMDETADGMSDYDEILSKQYQVQDRLEQMFQNYNATAEAQNQLAENNVAAAEHSIGRSLSEARKEVQNWANENIFPQMQQSTDKLAEYIDTNITPKISGWLDSGYMALESIAQNDVLNQIARNMKDAGSSWVDAFQNTNWEPIQKAANTLKDAGGDLATFVSWAIKEGSDAAAGAVMESANVAASAVNGVASIPQWIENFGGAVEDSLRGGAVGGGEFWSKVFDAKEGSILDEWAKGTLWGSAQDIGLAPTLENFNKALGNAYQTTQSDSEKIHSMIQDEITPKIMENGNSVQTTTDAFGNLIHQVNNAAADFERLSQTDLLSQFGISTSPTKKVSKPNRNVLPFADGGIVTRPTIGLIGEAGEKEAVIPLSKLGNVVGSVSSPPITYAPVIQVSGNANTEDIRQALSMGYTEFKRYMERLEKERRRAAF